MEVFINYKLLGWLFMKMNWEAKKIALGIFLFFFGRRYNI
jgi:hypothetical protein